MMYMECPRCGSNRIKDSWEGANTAVCATCGLQGTYELTYSVQFVPVSGPKIFNSPITLPLIAADWEYIRRIYRKGPWRTLWYDSWQSSWGGWPNTSYEYGWGSWNAYLDETLKFPVGWDPSDWEFPLKRENIGDCVEHVAGENLYGPGETFESFEAWRKAAEVQAQALRSFGVPKEFIEGEVRLPDSGGSEGAPGEPKKEEKPEVGTDTEASPGV